MIQAKSTISYIIITKYISDNNLYLNKDYIIIGRYIKNRIYRNYEFKDKVHENILQLLHI